MRKVKKDDNYETPESAWNEIFSFLPEKYKSMKIWDPFYCNGTCINFLQKYDFIHKNEDFFKYNTGDIIISNPPFSIKKDVLKRLKILNKPFILIMPSDTINRRYFDFDDIQIVVPKKRIHFIKESKQTNNCYFDCFYYCWKIGLKKDITFL